MKNNEFKLKIAIISTLIALLCLFGFNKLYVIYGVEKPLMEGIKAVPGVEEAALDQKQGQYQISIRLAQVDNLPETYQKIDLAIAKKLDAGSYKVVVKDQRNSKLDKFYDYAQLALFQTVNDKQYLQLDQNLQKNAQTAGIKCSLFVDEKHIYIQAIDGSSYMYEIVSHSSIHETGSKNGGKVS